MISFGYTFAEGGGIYESNGKPIYKGISLKNKLDESKDEMNW